MNRAFSAVILSLMLEGSAIAEQGQADRTHAACSELVRACFSLASLEKANCFYSSATHPFCDGTKLGELTYQRWAVAPIPASGRHAPSLLGPQVVDQKCLDSFDTLWSSSLISRGNLSSSDLSQLNTALTSCHEAELVEMPRP